MKASRGSISADSCKQLFGVNLAAWCSGQSGNLLAPAAAKDPEPIAEDPVLRLRKLVEERQDEALEILNNWMTEQEERA